MFKPPPRKQILGMALIESIVQNTNVQCTFILIIKEYFLIYFLTKFIHFFHVERFINLRTKMP